MFFVYLYYYCCCCCCIIIFYFFLNLSMSFNAQNVLYLIPTNMLQLSLYSEYSIDRWDIRILFVYFTKSTYFNKCIGIFNEYTRKRKQEKDFFYLLLYNLMINDDQISWNMKNSLKVSVRLEILRKNGHRFLK